MSGTIRKISGQDNEINPVKRERRKNNANQRNKLSFEGVKRFKKDDDKKTIMAGNGGDPLKGREPFGAGRRAVIAPSRHHA